MKKHNLFIAALLTVSFILGACGEEATVTDSVNDDKEPVTISYGLWGSESRQEYTMAQIEAFEQKYPYITVEVDYADWSYLKDEIDDIMAEDREPDVMQINYSWLRKYSSDGKGFYDLNKLSDIIQLDAFSDLSLTYGNVNGKLNALVIAMNTPVPIYNKTMYDYYDLPLPESVEELFADAEIMKADNIYQLGLPDNQIIMFLFGCYESELGISITDESGNLNIRKKGCVYLAETYKKLINNYVLCPRSEYSLTKIEGKRVAGLICWLNYIDQYKGYITEAGDEAEVGKFLWTDIDGRLGNYIKPATMLAISEHTEHPKEAALLVDYLLNDETAIDLQGVDKGVPDSRYAQKALMEDGSLNNDIFYTTLRLNYYMEYMQILPAALENEDVIDDILTILDSYAYGEKDLEETIAALKEIR